MSEETPETQGNPDAQETPAPDQPPEGQDAPEEQDAPKQTPAAIVITKDDVDKSPAAAQAAAAPPVAPMSYGAATPGGKAAPPKAPPQAEAPSPQVAPAGFWRRFFAKLFDVAFSLASFLAIAILLAAVLWLPAPLHVFYWESPQQQWEEFTAAIPVNASQLFFAYIVFYFLYSLAGHAANGSSVGKAICRIRVIVPEHADKSFFSRVLFFIARFVVATMSLTLLGVGHLLAGILQDQRALHDIVVGSRVVRKASAKE